MRHRGEAMRFIRPRLHSAVRWSGIVRANSSFNVRACHINGVRGASFGSDFFAPGIARRKGLHVLAMRSNAFAGRDRAGRHLTRSTRRAGSASYHRGLPHTNCQAKMKAARTFCPNALVYSRQPSQGRKNLAVRTFDLLSVPAAVRGFPKDVCGSLSDGGGRAPCCNPPGARSSNICHPPPTASRVVLFVCSRRCRDALSGR